MKKHIYNLTPFTLLDFPGKVACVVWFSGCGMRCGYCYNTEIVTGHANYTYEDALKFLQTRKGLLQGVVLCGGEPLFSFDDEMLHFIKEIKEMGFLVKLDTNGVNFKALQRLLDEKVLDFIALDFKAPKNKFQLVTKNKTYSYKLFLNSLKILIKHDTKFEVRTTVHQDLLGLDDIQNMVDVLESLNYRGDYCLQNFVESEKNFQNLTKRHDSFDIKKITSENLNILYRNF
ncbi:anaerobic ribonucleoside-triphosphate reductase activating protein [bacterium]|nr:anaerobic ribonucleoside-triphosphate reductase activating protein [bacterium]